MDEEDWIFLDLLREQDRHQLLPEDWEHRIRTGLYDTDPRSADRIVDEFLRSL